MEVIKLDDTVLIYKTNISYNKDELIKELYFNFQLNNTTTTADNAGRESTLVINSKNIDYIKLEAVNFIREALLSNREVNYCQKNWAYINDKTAKHTDWHSHEKNHVSTVLKNQWTYTFYVQMPNNLSNNEGKLSFKKSTKEYSILPDEGDIVVFPATLLHKPELSPNSTQERIVIGGNFIEIDINRALKKTQISLV